LQEPVGKRRKPCKMKPQNVKRDPQFDLFKIELNRIIDRKHPLAQLTMQMNWASFDEQFESQFADEGRPAIPTRLMVSLHYLKYTHDLSDEDTVALWVENPYWQYFSGRQHFEHKLPIDPSSMTRWRKRVGVDGAEALLSQTIQTALDQKHLKRAQCQRVNVDTTVQTKDIRFPTDARLYDRMRETLVKTAKDEDVELRQSYVRVGKRALRRQQNYGHAKQMKRAKKETRKLKTYLGRVIRDVERKANNPSNDLKEQLSLAKRLMEQKRNSKNKIYSIHEPHVECIAKGKVHQRYEFGCKVGFVTSAKGNWILSAKAFTGNPYDGHTLQDNLKQTEQFTKMKIQQATCDQGYRGHGIKDTKINIVPKHKKKASQSVRHWWKRRNAIEPIIGHSKSEHRLNRNQLAGERGDQLNAAFSACGFNIKKLLRAFWLWIQKAFNCFYQPNFQRTMILKF
jgi:transposase, IS5 family